MLFIPLGIFLFNACGLDEESTPKPTGYFRIDLPEKKYTVYDTTCPFSFKMPVYAEIRSDKRQNAEPCWINLYFDKFKATVHISYKPINNDTNLRSYLNDAYTFVTKHQIKASAIDEKVIRNDSLKVYGIAYRIEGNAASQIQFYLTDSSKHFMRGALYFNAYPNSDSIAPVLDFVARDIDTLISSFRWKNIK